MKNLLLWIILFCLPMLSFSQKNTTPRPQTPIMGWASWNNFRVAIDENIIKAEAEAMVSSGMKDAGYSYINIDDGYFGGRDKAGKIIPHPERFPNGMKSLADYIHSKGLKAGIYSDAGSNTCASRWDNDTIGSGMGLYGHDRSDLTQMLKEWNYDFIKVDWCGGQELDLDEQIRYTEISNIIRGINPEVVFNVCRWEFPGKWVVPTADSWRISGDISEKFESILHIIDLNADLWRYSGPGHVNDMDMLQVGRGMSYEEDKAHFTMWCIMESPLLAGNDLRKIVWAKPMVSTMSGDVAVVLLNRSNKKSRIEFSLDSLGLIAKNGYIMRDLWAKKDYPSTKNATQNFEVPAHGLVALRIKGTAKPFNVFQSK